MTVRIVEPGEKAREEVRNCEKRLLLFSFCTVCLLLSQSYGQNTLHYSNFSLQPSLLELASLFFSFRTCTKLCTLTHTHAQAEQDAATAALPSK